MVEHANDDTSQIAPFSVARHDIFVISIAQSKQNALYFKRSFSFCRNEVLRIDSTLILVHQMY